MPRDASRVGPTWAVYATPKGKGPKYVGFFPAPTKEEAIDRAMAATGHHYTDCLWSALKTVEHRHGRAA